MIVWISGAYGAGKSTVAEALKEKLGNAYLYDAEEMGNAVRDNYPSLHSGVIYEDYPLWVEFNYRLLKDIAARYDGYVLVPMTLLRQKSVDEILSRLAADGIDTRLFILEASPETLHDRILARGEDEDCWCMENREMARDRAAAVRGGIHVQTDGRTVGQVADEIFGRLKKRERPLDGGL